MTIFYDPSCLEYSSPGHPERPERIARTAPVLNDRHPDWEWRKPTAVMDAQLLHAHSRAHVEGVGNALRAARRVRFQLDAPAGTPRHARSRNGFLLFQQRCGRGARRVGKWRWT